MSRRSLALALALLAVAGPARAAVTVSGEVVIVEGDEQILATDGHGWGLVDGGFPVLARRVIEAVGDHFQTITVWLTFDDLASGDAVAYEMPVKNEVEGLGLRIFDQSRAFGSQGVLRAMLNMKTVALGTGSTVQSWAQVLSIWGQEAAHRWLVYLLFRDPRTNQASDALLGRGCAHYSRYVDTQASVHDGFAWKDNGDGTFTWLESNKRYGNLDLYAMGLMEPDEVPPFFLIDGIPGYTYPKTCAAYSSQLHPTSKTIIGTRVDITIDDVIAVNGPRHLPTTERQDYWREAEVILTEPAETSASPRVVAMARRLNQARLFWEDWNRQASRNRLVVCTRVTGDCGDPRSEVTALVFDRAGVAPGWGPVPVEVEVTNDGTRSTPSITATVEARLPDGGLRKASRAVGALAPAASRVVSVPLDLHGVDCGTEISLTASAQSDYHHHRRQGTYLVGVEHKVSDGFETDSGWTTNPDGDDSVEGAPWERGTPELTDLLGTTVQPGGAHSGADAWVTGLSATRQGDRSTLARAGRATLQSPPYDSAGLTAGSLSYWVSFAGLQGAGTKLIPSPQSRLLVQARAVGGADWVDLDTLSDALSAPLWVHRTVPLPPEVLGGAQFQLRFVAIDDNPLQGGVEAAIDDLEILSRLPDCDIAPPPGGGCAMSSRPSGRSGAVIAVLMALALAGRIGRRRAPR
jgi:hypothetical protein